MKNTLHKLGKRVATKPLRVLFTFIASIMVLTGVAGAVGAGFTTEVRLGNTDSQKASDLLVSEFPAASGDTATLVFYRDKSDGLVSAEAIEALEDSFATIKSQKDVETVTPLQLSEDKKTGFVNVQYTDLAANLSAEHLSRLEAAVEDLEGTAIEASMRGPVVDRWRDREPPVGEFIGIFLAIILITMLLKLVFYPLSESSGKSMAKMRLLAPRKAAGDALLLGVNCRDLVTLQVVPGRLELLANQLPHNVLRVAESGVESAADAARLASAGYDFALVGSALMKSGDASQLTAAMLDAARAARGGRPRRAR